MGYFSIWHWLIVLAIVVILFGGKGRIISICTDVAKGLKAFRKGLKEEDNTLEDTYSNDKDAK